MSEDKSPFLDMFDDPEHAATYGDGPAKFVPGFYDVHRMAGILMRERAPDDGKVLVHGAGGGLELEAFARENPGWRFVGVDPAKAMLDAAAERLGSLMTRTELHHGFIDDAPEGPFDAATSLLTLHFLDADERRRTVAEIVRRLKPGAPLVAVHVSFPSGAAGQEKWLSRYEAFALASGADPELAGRAREAVEASLPRLEPRENVELFGEAGLKDVTSFYEAFTWRGWVGYAP
ncbi:MAG: methyltransferase [Pseudomonadota bacterium]